MANQPHILHIGFSPWDLGAIDFLNYRNTLIVDQTRGDQIDAATKLKFAAIKTFVTSTAVDQDQYDKAFGEIQTAAEDLVAEYGIPQGVVGMYEHVTLPAARLREIYAVKGTSVRTATLCRDKIEMKRALRQTEIPFPRFMEITSDTSQAELDSFLNELGDVKIVVKPCSQAASQGVQIFSERTACVRWFESARPKERFDIEEFVEGDIYHFDGLVRGGELQIFNGFQCLGSCYDLIYRAAPFGAVAIDNRKLLAEAKEFTSAILHTFGLVDSVFHLEAIRSKSRGFVFLEIGNRFGGAGIPKVFSKVYGIDLPREAFLADVGEPPAQLHPNPNANPNPIGAYLWMPLTTNERSRTRAISGLDLLPPSVFHAETPQIGQWFNEVPTFFPNSGRFFFKGVSTAEILADAHQVIDHYKVRLETPEQWP